MDLINQIFPLSTLVEQLWNGGVLNITFSIVFMLSYEY
jgi:hypothetical protein